MTTTKIYCCGCAADVDARLTSGKEIYPHRPDLHELPLWVCDTCDNYVGCHHKTDTPTRPLGVIPTPHIRKERRVLHAIFDPIWESGVITRNQLYKAVSKHLGYNFHTANTKSVTEVTEVIVFLRKEYPQ